MFNTKPIEPMEEIKTRAEKISELSTDIKAIKNALLGDEYNPNGYIKRLEKVELTQTEFKEYKQRIIGAVIAINTMGAIIMILIEFILK